MARVNNIFVSSFSAPSAPLPFGAPDTSGAASSVPPIQANFTPIQVVPEFPTTPSPPIPLTSSAPSLEPVLFTSPISPTPFVGDIDIGNLLPEPFDDEPPLLAFPTAPDAFSSVAPTSVGVQLQYEEPTLSVNLPAPPNLFSLSTRSFDGVTLPTIDENVPELVAVAPTITQYTPGDFYNSALLSEAQATLLDRIKNGGTGLPPEVENAIWDRGREREAIAYREALDELDKMETMGFSLPPGVYVDARLKVNTEMRARTVSISREVMIKQAELEVQNIRESLGQAIQLESTLINYNNQVEQRLFDAAKYSTDAGIAIYNARVQAYAAFLDAYKTKVAIYEAKIRGELAKVEAYRSEIAAEQAKADINNALVNQFTAQTNAALSAVEIYKAQIAGIQAKADIEKLKVSIFGEQVRAYTARIGAYTAQVEGFKASVQAESAKQEAFRNQVVAYSAKVDAAVKVADARIEEYKGRLQAKIAEWEAYKSAYQGEAAKAQAITANNSTLVDGYRAEVAALTGYNDVLTRQWQAAVAQAQAQAEIGVSAAKANSDSYMTSMSLAADASKASAQVAAQVAAARLNQVNYSFNNSRGYSVGYSVSNSAAFNAGVSDSTSSNANENFNV
jgi:hypothetical protein